MTDCPWLFLIEAIAVVGGLFVGFCLLWWMALP